MSMELSSKAAHPCQDIECCGSSDRGAPNTERYTQYGSVLLWSVRAFPNKRPANSNPDSIITCSSMRSSTSQPPNSLYTTDTPLTPRNSRIENHLSPRKYLVNPLNIAILSTRRPMGINSVIRSRVASDHVNMDQDQACQASDREPIPHPLTKVLKTENTSHPRAGFEIPGHNASDKPRGQG